MSVHAAELLTFHVDQRTLRSVKYSLTIFRKFQKAYNSRTLQL